MRHPLFDLVEYWQGVTLTQLTYYNVARFLWWDSLYKASGLGYNTATSALKRNSSNDQHDR